MPRLREYDICQCGDFRRDHEDDGIGRCKMANDINHGYKPCLRFKFSHESKPEEIEKQLALERQIAEASPAPPAEYLVSIVLTMPPDAAKRLIEAYREHPELVRAEFARVDLPVIDIELTE